MAETRMMGIEMVNFAAAFALDQRQRTDALPPGETPCLAVVMSNPIAANVSYVRSLADYGPTVGVRTDTLFPESDEEAVEMVQRLVEDPDVDKILPILRARTDEGEQRIREAISPAKDVDGVGLPEPGAVPATARAMALSGEHISGRKLPEMGRIAVVGDGLRTLAPLVQQILVGEYGIEPAVHLRSRDDIKALQDGDEALVSAIGECEIVFSAVPIGGLLRPDRGVRPGQIIVDAGYGEDPDTGEEYGNVHPDAHQLPDVRATAFRRAVGLVTRALVMGETIAAREQKVASRILAGVA